LLVIAPWRLGEVQAAPRPPLFRENALFAPVAGRCQRQAALRCIEASAEHIPGARFIGYPQGGHLWVGHHGELMAEIAGFLPRAAAR
jgi:hypothetical protein